MITTATMIKIAVAVLGVIAWLAKKASERSAAMQAQAGAQAGAPSGGPSADAVGAYSDDGPRSAQQSAAPKVTNAGVARASRGKKQPKVLARGGASPKPSGTTPSAAKASAQFGDSSVAMQSRQHLAEQVARLKAAEARVAHASGIKAHHAADRGRGIKPTQAPAAAVSAAELRRSLANPAALRKALILGEILGRPRADRAI